MDAQAKKPMDELENYECFAVPAHVWSDSPAVPVPARGSPQRHAVATDSSLLGIEAFPSPALPEPLAQAR
jgi:hypothetical protein